MAGKKETNEKLRLDKFLVNQGKGTRSEVHKLIKSKKVEVNGEIAKLFDMKVTPQQDIITVDKKQVEYNKYVYLMMNKPAGVLTATEDKHASTVLDLVPDEMKVPGLSPAGRLDKDAEGLLILTNDGVFAHRLISPKWKVPKVYEVEVEQNATNEGIAMFKEGITLADGTECKSAILENIDENHVKVVLSEGKFHQVKRMLGVIDCPVIKLKRVAMGNVKLDDELEPGSCRKLTKYELDELNITK